MKRERPRNAETSQFLKQAPGVCNHSRLRESQTYTRIHTYICKRASMYRELSYVSSGGERYRAQIWRLRFFGEIAIVRVWSQSGRPYFFMHSPPAHPSWTGPAVGDLSENGLL